MCEYGTTVPVNVWIAADLSATGTRYMKVAQIDSCIAPIVRALQAEGIDMRASCCGHGQGSGYIALQDGRLLQITPDGAEPSHEFDGDHLGFCTYCGQRDHQKDGDVARRRGLGEA